MNVTGVYRRGKVTLDQQVDWPEGSQVQVLREPGADVARVDTCADGSPWQDSSAAIQQWVQWLDSLEPVFAGEELERFQRDLRAARHEQSQLVPKWQEKVDHLLQ